MFSFDTNIDEKKRTIGGLMTRLGLDAGNFKDVFLAGIASDSRNVRPGYIFFAMPGTTKNGKNFIDDAVKAGAIAIIGSGLRPPDLDSIVFYQHLPNIRHALAIAASYFYPKQPEHLLAVTGTAGKTSVCDFVRQIFSLCGHRAASIGTLGILGPEGNMGGSLTTPDPLLLHENLERLTRASVSHVVMEASSHGLDQARLDCVRLSVAAFTNFGRDHLDYHPNVQAYLQAKLRLFTDILPAKGRAIINMDDGRGPEVAVAAAFAHHDIWTIGKKGETLKILSITPESTGQRVRIVYNEHTLELLIPLIGSFQAENALLAALMVISVGERPEKVFAALHKLKGVPGRLEQVGHFNSAPIFIDYAHKPEALAHALEAMRPFVSGKLVLVFGCGGDRDSGKRGIMGKIAQEKADIVIVTDDNPRSENPASIRSAILAAAPKALEMADRSAAIRQGIACLQKGDALIIAGKGHETGQIIGDKVMPFSDQVVALTAIKALS